MNHNRARAFLPALQPGHISRELDVSSGIYNADSGEPAVVLGDRLGAGIVILKQRQQGKRGGRAARELSETVHKTPPADSPMHVLVVEVDDFLLQWTLLSVRNASRFINANSRECAAP